MKLATILFVPLCALPTAAQAQVRGQSLDAAVGIGGVHRGTYKSAAGPAVAVRWGLVSRAGWLTGVSGTMQTGLPTGDECRSDGNGGCLRPLPSVRSLAVLAGHAFTLGIGTVPWSIHTGAGIGVTWAGINDYRGTSTMGGAHAHIDLASPGRRLAFVASLHSSYIPALPRGGRGTRALTIGFRIP